MDNKLIYTLILSVSVILILIGVKLVKVSSKSLSSPLGILGGGYGIILTGLGLMFWSVFKNKDKIFNKQKNTSPNPSPNPSPDKKPDKFGYRIIFILELLVLLLGLTYVL